MSWIKKRKFKKYLKKLNKIHKRLHNNIPRYFHGKNQILHYILQAKIHSKNIINILEGEVDSKDALKEKRKKLYIINQRMKNARQKARKKKKKKLDPSEHHSDMRFLADERQIIKNEIKQMIRELQKDLPNELEYAINFFKDQMKILREEVILFNKKYENHIVKIENQIKEEIQNENHNKKTLKKKQKEHNKRRKHYNKKIRPYLKTLSKIKV